MKKFLLFLFIGIIVVIFCIWTPSFLTKKTVIHIGNDEEAVIDEITADEVADSTSEEVQNQEETQGCPKGSWVVLDHKEEFGDYKSWRLFYEGVPTIKNGGTPKNAMDEWLENAKQFPETYIMAYELAFNSKLNMSYIDVDGHPLYTDIPAYGECATQEMVENFAKIKEKFNTFTVLPKDSNDPRVKNLNPKRDWYNSFVWNDTVRQMNRPGVFDPVEPKEESGFWIIRDDGYIFFIWGVCGNIATYKPVVKPVEKVEKEIPYCKQDKNKEKPKCNPKDPKKDPSSKGNAPKGGGKNEDQGPGEYQPPSKVTEPPATQRVNPDPPKPTPSTDIPIGSTSDNTEAPKPEENAPTPGNPATGTVTVPGM